MCITTQTVPVTKWSADKHLVATSLPLHLLEVCGCTQICVTVLMLQQSKHYFQKTFSFNIHLLMRLFI